MRPITYRPAGALKRTMAYLIDTIPICLALYLVSFGIFDVNPLATIQDAPLATVQAGDLAKLMISSGTLIVWICYCIVAELTPWQGTFGKRTMGIRVRVVGGGAPKLKHVLIRNLTKILSWLPLCLGFFAAYVSYGNRAWHDKLSGTAVVE